MRRVTLWGLACAIVFVAGCLFYQTNEMSARKTTSNTGTPISSPNTRSAMLWNTRESSVAELTTDADLIVYAKVVDSPRPRMETFAGPIWSEDGRIVGQTEVNMIFSDTQMKVFEVYKGESADSITVMQTGGARDPTQAVSNSSVRWLSVRDDPLYRVGEESVLFLVDISEDPIHAHSRTLYRVINPAGRYTVEGDDVQSRFEFPPTVVYPQTVKELVSQIQEAVSE